MDLDFVKIRNSQFVSRIQVTLKPFVLESSEKHCLECELVHLCILICPVLDLTE